MSYASTGKMVTLDLDAGSTASDLWFVLSNETSTKPLANDITATSSSSIDSSAAARSGTVAASRDINGTPVKLLVKDAQPDRSWSKIPLTPLDSSIRKSRDAARSTRAVTNPDSGITTHDFDDYGVTVPATLRYASDAVTFPDGNLRTLSIWVANDCWDGATVKTHNVTQAMVDALATRFFGTDVNGHSDSIYSWVTNAIGEEWGDVNSNEVIPFNNNITILLCDIDQDNTDAVGTVGKFWAINNYTASVASEALQTWGINASSNERVMFFLDAVMLACPSDDGVEETSSWVVTDPWPQFVFSTLTHEFQHMIHFYQKSILRNAVDSHWTDEMCSMIMEDLVADKLGVEGPRGVNGDDYSAGSSGNTGGRLPLFNYYSAIGIQQADIWWNTINPPGYSIYLPYSTTYAFGAYLSRNYGGVNFLKSVVQSSSSDDISVLDAASSADPTVTSFGELIRRWGAATILSSSTSAPEHYRLNTGTSFDSSVGNATYRLGSINLWNYPQKYLYYSNGTLYYDLDVAGPRSVETDDEYAQYSGGKWSNSFHLAKSGVKGASSWEVTVPSGFWLTSIFK